MLPKWCAGTSRRLAEWPMFPWGLCQEAGHDCRCCWAEHGFGWCIFQPYKETGFAFQMHVAHWRNPHAWQKADISARWAATRWAKKIEARERKEKITNFDHYKVFMKAKKIRNRIIKLEVRKLQKAVVLRASPRPASVAKGEAAATAANVPTKEGATAAGKKAPAQGKLQARRLHPKAQKSLKAPTHEAPAPKASVQKAWEHKKLLWES